MFKVVIPSYNNEAWAQYNVASILNQTYDNYEVLYINDASKDSTLSIVSSMVQDLPNWKVITNDVNRRRGYNISPYNEHITSFIDNPNDVLVFIDGDDWLYDDDVFYNLNRFYNEKDCWMTYGGMVCYPGGEVGYPQNTSYDSKTHQHKAYRKDVWRASHLRTFKWGLYNKIEQEHMLYSNTKEYYFHAEDLATSYPCLEMCPQEKIGVLDFYSYVFNATPANRERGVAREAEAGHTLELEIRNIIPYKELTRIDG